MMDIFDSMELSDSSGFCGDDWSCFDGFGSPHSSSSSMGPSGTSTPSSVWRSYESSPSTSTDNSDYPLTSTIPKYSCLSKLDIVERSMHFSGPEYLNNFIKQSDQLNPKCDIKWSMNQNLDDGDFCNNLTNPNEDLDLFTIRPNLQTKDLSTQNSVDTNSEIKKWDQLNSKCDAEWPLNRSFDDCDYGYLAKTLVDPNDVINEFMDNFISGPTPQNDNPSTQNSVVENTETVPDIDSVMHDIYDPFLMELPPQPIPNFFVDMNMNTLEQTNLDDLLDLVNSEIHDNTLTDDVMIKEEPVDDTLLEDVSLEGVNFDVETEAVDEEEKHMLKNSVIVRPTPSSDIVTVIGYDHVYCNRPVIVEPISQAVSSASVENNTPAPVKRRPGRPRKTVVQEPQPSCSKYVPKHSKSRITKAKVTFSPSKLRNPQSPSSLKRLNHNISEKTRRQELATNIQHVGDRTPDFYLKLAQAAIINYRSSRTASEDTENDFGTTILNIMENLRKENSDVKGRRKSGKKESKMEILCGVVFYVQDLQKMCKARESALKKAGRVRY